MLLSWRAFWALSLVAQTLTTLACSSQSSKEYLGAVTYALERGYTNATTNRLRLSVPTDIDFTEFSLMIRGNGFGASVPLGEVTGVPEGIDLSYLKEGVYALDFVLYYSDNVPFVADTLKWDYSTEAPRLPVVSFSEEATNDEDVVLILAASRGKYTNEIWISGDTSTGEGSWVSIPANNAVPTKVSSADGLKTVKVKLRNLYGTESAEVTASILKKSQGPTDCQIVPAAMTVRDGSVPIYIAAANEGPLYYLVTGDVADEDDFIQFTDQTTPTVTLAAGDGVKNISVQVRDAAANYCETKRLAITVDPNYQPASLEIKDEPFWVLTQSITLVPHFDHLPSDSMEMFISGDIEPDSNTDAWVSYQSPLDLTLKGGSGPRYIRIKYRFNGAETSTYSATVYLEPFLVVSGTGGSRTLTPSNIPGLSSLSISGCNEVYDAVSFQASFPCTTTGSSVSIRYDFPDGRTLTRTAAVN